MAAPFIVTLDGPAGVGKTTMARMCAERLGIAYLDTGAMFRTLALRLGPGAHQLPPEELEARAAALPFTLCVENGQSVLRCAGDTIGQEIRTEEVGMLASTLGTVPVIREVLKKAQRAIGATTSLVAEGRDMGTVVFPQAACKFFLDASPEVRAARRLRDLQARGGTGDLATIAAQIRERDAQDRGRAVAPLRPAEDAILLDSSDHAIPEVLAMLLDATRPRMAAAALTASRAGHATVHFITNYVIVNDCANMTIAAGGSPIMADDPRETEEITALCDSLVINMGTPSERTVNGMFSAGKKAAALGHPIVFDPCGAGASTFRNELATKLLREIPFAVIKGNISEIRFLSGQAAETRGVDAGAGDIAASHDLAGVAAMAKALAARTGAVVVVSGAVDVVACADEAWAVHNGDILMSRVSGSGCMGSATIGAFVGADPAHPLAAALGGMCAMGVAGEHARDWLDCVGGGNASYRTYLIDAMSNLDFETLVREMRVERIA